MKFDARTPVVKRSPRAWYIKGVNMNYSFETLEHLATELGASVKKGDILIVDNNKGNCRKAFKKTSQGHVILYARMTKGNTFTELNKSGQGKINNSTGTPLIDLFNA